MMKCSVRMGLECSGLLLAGGNLGLTVEEYKMINKSDGLVVGGTCQCPPEVSKGAGY